MASVLITGCSSGFGYLAALRFARNGDHVFATMRNTAKAVELERVRDAAKLPITVLQLDVNDQASVDRAVRDATAQAPIDVLVNNAGLELRSPVETATDDEIRRQFETNVFGTMRVIRAVVPAMRERGAGVVVNVSSIAGFVPPPYAGFYAASKHALEAISEAMHYELKPFGVRVVIIEPGAFATQFGSNAFDSQHWSESSPYWDYAQRFQAKLDTLLRPEGPPADPDDVAKMIVETAHDPKARLRHVVGNDATMIAAVRKSTDFEGFEQAMRQTLDWWE